MLTNHHPQLPFSDPRFWHPAYWPTWLGLGLLWCWLLLPFGGQQCLAALCGRILYHLAQRRRHITEVNIRRCFPELSAVEQKRLVKQIFFENLWGLIETARTFWASTLELQSLQERVRFDDLPQLQQALAQQRGIILIGAHYSTLDLGGVLFSLFADVTILYRTHNNALFDIFLKQARLRWATQVLSNTQMTAIVRVLRKQQILWFPADQDYGTEHSVFAPFFGLPAATITTPAWLAKLSGSPVLVLGHHRCGKRTYQLTLQTLTNLPVNDDLACATTINAALERQIRQFPAQYMWPHRRFKHQPDGEDFYRR